MSGPGVFLDWEEDLDLGGWRERARMAEELRGVGPGVFLDLDLDLDLFKYWIFLEIFFLELLSKLFKILDLLSLLNKSLKLEVILLLILNSI